MCLTLGVIFPSGPQNPPITGALGPVPEVTIPLEVDVIVNSSASVGGSGYTNCAYPSLRV